MLSRKTVKAHTSLTRQISVRKDFKGKGKFIHDLFEGLQEDVGRKSLRHCKEQFVTTEYTIPEVIKRNGIIRNTSKESFHLH